MRTIKDLWIFTNLLYLTASIQAMGYDTFKTEGGSAKEKLIGGGKVAEKAPGPLLGTIWWMWTIITFAYVAARQVSNVYNVFLGWRSAVALAGYLIMQVGLWKMRNSNGTKKDPPPIWPLPRKTRA